MPSRRILKVNELIKREVGKIILEMIDDPRFGFVTVTRVDTSPDLEQAKVFLSYLGTKTKQEEGIRRVIQENAYEIQNRLNHTLEMKNVPKLVFDFDYSARNAARVEKLLKEIEDEKDSLQNQLNDRSSTETK